MNFILNLKGLEQMEITNTLLLMAIGIPGILVATTIHEFTRALLSTIFGDNYPKSHKRLTLNPCLAIAVSWLRHFPSLHRVIHRNNKQKRQQAKVIQIHP